MGDGTAKSEPSLVIPGRIISLRRSGTLREICKKSGMYLILTYMPFVKRNSINETMSYITVYILDSKGNYMNVVTYIISRFLRSGSYGRALALLPLLGKVKMADLFSGAKRIFRYIASGKARKRDILIMILGIIYLISPFNALTLPFGGFLIDAAIVTFLLSFIGKRANEYMEKES